MPALSCVTAAALMASGPAARPLQEGDNLPATLSRLQSLLDTAAAYVDDVVVSRVGRGGAMGHPWLAKLCSGFPGQFRRGRVGKELGKVGALAVPARSHTKLQSMFASPTASTPHCLTMMPILCWA